MTDNERKMALAALRKTKGDTSYLVTQKMEQLTESDILGIMKLLDCKIQHLEDEIQFVWIRYFMLVKICGKNSLEVLSLP